MVGETGESEFLTLLDGLRIDAVGYFERAEKALEGVEVSVSPFWEANRSENWDERDQYWSQLPEPIQNEGRRLSSRLVSLAGHIARAARNAPLLSEADQRELMKGTKAMRAALLLRRFRSWDTEILNNEDIVLGVNPPGQSDNEPLAPEEAKKTFEEWAENVRSIIDLLLASPNIGPAAGQEIEPVRYRPGTAFIMMWMDKSKPDLVTYPTR